jgi:hypothetical protein
MDAVGIRALSKSNNIKLRQEMFKKLSLMGAAKYSS